MPTYLVSTAANALASALPAAVGTPGGTVGNAGPVPFANVLHEAMASVKVLEEQASNAVEGLVAGRGVDIHTAMIATQKSDLAFEMALAVRGKAVAAYQSLMSVQF
jgi:flagellar hook-basal body complex protein FliE